MNRDLNILLPRSDVSVQKGTNGDTSVIEKINGKTILVGKNGTGKSKLAEWMILNMENLFSQKVFEMSTNLPELNNRELREYIGERLHYIHATKELTLQGSINPLSLKRAKQKLLQRNQDTKSPNRPSSGFQESMAILLAEDIKFLNKYQEEIIEKIDSNKKEEIQKPRETNNKKLVRIWNSLFPYISIKIEDYNILAENPSTVPVDQMSDGERNALFLVAKILSIPNDSIIIVDEPNTHFHQAIKSTVWKTLEEEKSSCIFFYITHDLEFAVKHPKDHLYWMQEFELSESTMKWKYEEIKDYEELPEDLLISVLGNRKEILFVEGDSNNSIDIELYTHVFPYHKIIPCESSSKVVEATKSFANNSSLHYLKPLGIIDRDYHTQAYLESIEEFGIKALEVAEIENLFCVPEIMEVIAVNQKQEYSSILPKIKNTIFTQRLKKEIGAQTRNKARYHLRNKLEQFASKEMEKTSFCTDFENHINGINAEEEFEKAERLYNDILTNQDIRNCLKYYNSKGLYSNIARVFGQTPEGYKNLIFSLLKSNTSLKTKIIDGLKKYIPHCD